MTARKGNPCMFEEMKPGERFLGDVTRDEYEVIPGKFRDGKRVALHLLTDELIVFDEKAPVQKL